MVDPACITAAIAAIDELATLQTKEKRVIRIIRIQSGTLLGLFFGNARSPVFDDARPSGNFTNGKDAATMDLRVADLDRCFCGHLCGIAADLFHAGPKREIESWWTECAFCCFVARIANRKGDARKAPDDSPACSARTRASMPTATVNFS